MLRDRYFGLIAGTSDVLHRTVIFAGGPDIIRHGTLMGLRLSDDKYVVCKANATDGSQIPAGVCAGDCDVTHGDTHGPMYTHGEFMAEAMVIDPSWTVNGVQAVLRQHSSDLYVRSRYDPH